MKLRDYQNDMLQQNMDAVKEHGPGVGIMDQLPTGGGKTPIAAAQLAVFQQLVPDRPHCWLTHRQELRGQSSKHIRRFGLTVRDMTSDPPDSRFWYPNCVNMVSPALRRWPELRGRLGLMCVDEGHHTPAATWSKLVQEWRNRGGYVIAFTATPWRMNKRQGFEPWYDELILGPSVTELQDRGFLATPRVYLPGDISVDDTYAKLMSTGEFAYEWMESEISMLIAHKPVMQYWRKRTKKLNDKRTMWFVPTVYCAHELKRLILSLEWAGYCGGTYCRHP